MLNSLGPKLPKCVTASIYLEIKCCENMKRMPSCGQIKCKYLFVCLNVV